MCCPLSDQCTNMEEESLCCMKVFSDTEDPSCKESCPTLLTDEVLLQVPQRLQSIFEANFDLLLSIFNPEGYLDITYCDEDMRCGRDDKGHIFVLEREKEHVQSRHINLHNHCGHILGAVAVQMPCLYNKVFLCKLANSLFSGIALRDKLQATGLRDHILHAIWCHC